MELFEKLLTKLAIIQKKYPIAILLFFIVFTIFIGSGIKDLAFEGDINKEMPQQLPIYQLNNRVADTFGGQDAMFILIELDDSLNTKNTPSDIRDPTIMKFVTDLDEALNHESAIEEVISLKPIIKHAEAIYQTSDLSLNQIISITNNIADSSKLISKDKKMTMVMILAEVGQEEEQVKAITDLITTKINSVSQPAGVKISITGTPSIISTVIGMLKNDAGYTLIIAIIIIILLLVIIEKSFLKATLIAIPILLGLGWTMGTMGWLGLKISVATAGLGAMILGLGVEYGVFMLTRYYEERKKGKTQEESVTIAVPAVGASVMGSGMTTIIGFLALTLSIMPMMQHLGASLALGIFFCIVSTLFIEPPLLMLFENFEYATIKRKKYKYHAKRETHKQLPR